MMKSILQSRPAQSFLGYLLASYMVLIKYSTRWTIERADSAAPIITGGEGLIALTWHSRLLMLNSAWKKIWQQPYMLISRSRDGALVSYTCRLLGIKTIRGSSKKAGARKAKGGARAFLQMKTALDQGGCVVITPDGPRGPRQRLGRGALRLARISGAPILPCTFSVSRRITFNSWDRFILPLPFGRGTIIWGTPITVPKDADETIMANIQNQIETEMNALLQDADEAMGHTPILPDPLQSDPIQSGPTQSGPTQSGEPSA